MMIAYSADGHICSDPAVKAGAPCIAGVRIPVDAVAGRFDRGESLEGMIADWPHVTHEQLLAAVAYARLV